MIRGAKASSKEQLVVVEPVSPLSFKEVAECWRYRDLIKIMAVRDIQARYKQSMLGPIWIILQPLMTMLIFTVIFGLIAKLPSGGKPYAVFSYVALLPWNLFAGIVSSSADCLVSNRHLIEKVYFPRLVLPLARVLTQLFDFGINLFILAALLVYFKQVPTWHVLAVPLYVLLTVMLGLGVGLSFSSWAARFRDVLQVSAFGVRFWMYATPVVYSLEAIPAKFRAIMEYNPMAHVVEGFRWAFLGEAATFSPLSTWVCLGGTLFLLVLSVMRFTVSSSKVVDIS